MTNIPEYIATFPSEAQEIMRKIHELILLAAPDCTEQISYGMPAYKLNGKPLVYFAGYKKHIGFYATPNGHEAFKDELSRYKQGKGSVQFPLNEAIPYELIKQIIIFRRDSLLNV